MLRVLLVRYDKTRPIHSRPGGRWQAIVVSPTLDPDSRAGPRGNLRLVDQSAPQWQSYPHFLAVASTAIRQILLDYAKPKRAAKLGAGIGGFPP